MLSDHPLKVKTIPSISSLISGGFEIAELKDTKIEDLLGREPVQHNPDLMAKTIAEKTVLVTGAGGSIGSELCRQIILWKPRKLILLDVSEFAIYALLEDLKQPPSSHAIDLIPLIGSVQDRPFIEKIFNKVENKVIIEELLEGKELSYFTITDGNDYLNFGSAQDYKRIGDNDTGPNTGGMGTVSPAPILNEDLEQKIQNQIILKTIDGLKRDNIEFQGVLFFGIMVDQDNNPFLLEYNTRFGDPEIQSISLRLKSDFLSTLHATATKNLRYANINFITNKKSVCLILATQGYPDDYPKNTIIDNLNNFENTEDFYIFHAATRLENNKVLSTGGRVLSIVSLNENYYECREKVYEIANKIEWENKYFRGDIGSNL